MLTPEDLVDYPLKLAVRGYSVAQVDQLLDQAADSLERLHQRVADLEQQLESCQERLTAAAETEETLKRTLVTAQRAAEQALDEARERARTIVDDAEASARRQTLEAERRRRHLEDHIAELREFEEGYRDQLREHLEERLRQLEGLGPTVAPLRDHDEVPSDVADLLELPPEGGDDRPPLRVRVHDGPEDDPTDGGDANDRPLAWPPSGEGRAHDGTGPGVDPTGE